MSTIPHATLDFESGEESVKALANLLQERLNQKEFVNDARVKMALSRLSGPEIFVIREIGKSDPGQGWVTNNFVSNPFQAAGIPRLLDKGIIELSGKSDGGLLRYKFTELGSIVSRIVLKDIPQLKGY